jgi:large subunit ribosomal protein L21
MYAIVDIKGKQFKVEKDQELLVPKINKEIGSKIEFDKILLTNDGGEISTKSSLKITAEVLSHEKGDKVLVFKMKRRKGYQKKNGHKQDYTKIKIQNLGSVTKKVAPKKTTAKKTTTKKVVEKK